MTIVKSLTPAGRRVLEVASDLFYRYGINSVGMELVAERAGVTKKTIYDRFGSKDALVTAYLESRDRRWHSWLRERIDGAADARATILATFDALGEWMDAENPRGCAFVNAAAELADPEHPGRRVAEAQKRWVRELYGELTAKTGAAPDVADALFMLHEGAVIAYNVAGIRNATTIARTAAETLLER